jgi:hypothetical protein
MTNKVRSANALNLRSPVLQVNKRSEPTELEKARAETELLRTEVAAAHKSAAESQASMQRSSRDAKFRLRATAAIMMTAALLKMAWEAAHSPTAVPTPSRAQPLAQSTKSGKVLTDQSPGAVALERLRDAFHSFPGRDQTDLVREVNEKYAGTALACPLVWTDGVPSLYVGDPKGMAPASMVDALNRCATAIEKRRQQTGTDYPVPNR